MLLLDWAGIGTYMSMKQATHTLVVLEPGMI